jgi:transcriptional regulator with XRE-family HTH domain
MATPSSFGVALRSAREAAGLSQTRVAHEMRTYPQTVHRWEKSSSIPTMEVRIALVRLLKDAPRPLLEELAEESNLDLASLGMEPPPPAAPAPSAPLAAPAPPPPPAPPPVIPATAQAMVDDALREAAEEIDVAPRALRPALSRMLDRLARGGVPMDAAARMVLGVPKKPAATAGK